MCLRPRKWDCCSDLFCQNWRSFNKQQRSCKSNGTTGSRATVADWRPHSPSWSKRACCQSLPQHHVVWNCWGRWRRHSHHGVGEVLIPLRHCWPDAFSAFALAVDRFIMIGHRTAQLCFGLLMHCLFLGSPPSPPLDSLAPPLARAGDVRPPVRPHVRPYVRPPAKPSCGFQHTHGSEFLSLANIYVYHHLYI